MKRITALCIAIAIFSCLSPKSVLSQTVAKVSAAADTIIINWKAREEKALKDQVEKTSYLPFVSLQQIIKGNKAGVYVQEPSGEPGTDQNIFIRGITAPLLSKTELFNQQAAVYLNGIPLTMENPFAYEIQKYDFNRIGPATNLLSSLQSNNIQKIEVIKDAARLAQLGPVAANGAIMVTSKGARAGESQINVNIYGGANLQPNYTPVNADYENRFRARFYNAYGTISDAQTYPDFLRDSTNLNYYGPANWGSSYYRNAPVYSADFSISGGTDRASILFYGSATQNGGVADKTSLSRYTGNFYMTVVPISWLTVSSMLSYSYLDRKRNKNIRDRVAEQKYLPDFSNPLTPYNVLYNRYLEEFDKAIDKNISNVLRGYLALNANFNKVQYDGKIGFDYNEGIREYFTPTTLLEGINFGTNYFGYNQRLLIENKLSYKILTQANHEVKIGAGQQFMADVVKYDYAYFINGVSDFTKTPFVEGNIDKPTYLKEYNFYYIGYPAKMQSRLVSFAGNINYKFQNLLDADLIIRRDGSSNMQPDNRWFTSYAGNVSWNLLNQFLQGAKNINNLKLNIGYAKLGKLLSDDRFNAGPNYRVEIAWPNEPTLGSFAGFPGLSRPYNSGWVGYKIPWAYSNKFNAGISYTGFDGKLSLNVEVYKRDDKDQLIALPVALEFGYKSTYKTGLDVQNTGMDIELTSTLIPASEKGIGLSVNANFNYNKNKLLALPEDRKELILGNSKFVVGSPIDAFWVLTNEGMYANDVDVPAAPSTGKKLNYRGIALKAGDPKWKDYNNDFVVDAEDKQLKGNYLPKMTGGFGADISYKEFALNFQFYYALGHKALNKYASARLNFINTESANDINSVKEISFWENKQDLFAYPLYNPWSNVIPFRIDQDLFLDDASFLKLRSVYLSYTPNKMSKKAVFYISGANLFTITKFKAGDPELVDYNGYYSGYGMPIPRSVMIGVKLSL